MRFDKIVESENAISNRNLGNEVESHGLEAQSIAEASINELKNLKKDSEALNKEISDQMNLLSGKGNSEMLENTNEERIPETIMGSLGQESSPSGLDVVCEFIGLSSSANINLEALREDDYKMN